MLHRYRGYEIEVFAEAMGGTVYIDPVGRLELEDGDESMLRRAAEAVVDALLLVMEVAA